MREDCEAKAVRPASPLVTACVLGVVLAAGCYSMSTLQEPETLPPGGLRVTPKFRLAHGAAVLADDGPGIRPALDADLRIGLVEGLELQVGAGAMLGRLGFKLLLIDWESLRLAIAPTYQGQYMREDSDESIRTTASKHSSPR